MIMNSSTHRSINNLPVLIPYLESTTSNGALNALPQLIFLLLTFWVREGQLCEGGGVSFKYVSFLSTYIELQ